ncbi:MAG: flagellar basal body rod protein FlgC [Bacillota bacterium]|nr:flagellar basal body rod protein FlgC [Bacillota bacterium]
MAFLSSLNISGSALTAQKLRMDVIAQNISNAQTTRTESGEPYRRKMVVFQENDNQSKFENILTDAQEKTQYTGGVKVSGVVEDQSDLKPVYDPSNPDANENGYVMMPNVDTAKEMIDMISSTRSYEANVTAFNSIKAMAEKALDIGR